MQDGGYWPEWSRWEENCWSEGSRSRRVLAIIDSAQVTWNGQSSIFGTFDSRKWNSKAELKQRLMQNSVACSIRLISSDCPSLFGNLKVASTLASGQRCVSSDKLFAPDTTSTGTASNHSRAIWRIVAGFVVIAPDSKTEDYGFESHHGLRGWCLVKTEL